MNDENTKKTLAQELKRLREAKFGEMSLRRVANEEVEIEYTHLFRLEAGQYVPSDENLKKLLDAYEASPEERLRVFSLARLTPAHLEAYEEAQKTLSDADVVSVMFRRPKEPPTNSYETEK